MQVDGIGDLGERRTLDEMCLALLLAYTFNPAVRAVLTYQEVMVIGGNSVNLFEGMVKWTTLYFIAPPAFHRWRPESRTFLIDLEE